MSLRDGREWLDDDGLFLFGKCQGEHVGDVARDDPGYLRWILDKDVIETALQFRKRR